MKRCNFKTVSIVNSLADTFILPLLRRQCEYTKVHLILMTVVYMYGRGTLKFLSGLTVCHATLNASQGDFTNSLPEFFPCSP